MRVVHIGFPKTASTFLQASVFTQLPDDFAYFDSRASAPYFDPVIDFDDTIFDLSDHRLRLARAWGASRHALFSYEPLTGAHYRSGFVNRTLIARRLEALGFDRAIITIRNQFDALESAYKQYIKSGGILKFDEYVNFDGSGRRYLYPEYFDYCSIYRLYAETFGRENVLVLQCERLSDASFFAELGEFLDVELPPFTGADRVNVSLSYAKTKVLRIVNHLTCSSHQPSHLISRRISTSFVHRQLARLPLLESRKKSFLTGEKRAVVAAFYSASNRRLSSESGISLAPDYP